MVMTEQATNCDAGRVIVVGSVNVDLTTRVARQPAPGETVAGEGLSRWAGGKGANQAMSAARSGARVAMVAAVGADEAGRSYRRRLAEAGIDVSRVREVEGPTGHALITVADSGENAIVVIAGANADHTGESVRQDLAALRIGPGDVLVTVLEIPLEAVAAAVESGRTAGARVVLNLAPFAVVDPGILNAADPVVVNEHEGEQLADAGLLPESLLVTLGAEGARWGSVQVPGVAVDGEVLDTTGAGDAFCGALAAALAAGGEHSAAVQAAVAAGTLAVQHRGAQPDPEL